MLVTASLPSSSTTHCVLSVLGSTMRRQDAHWPGCPTGGPNCSSSAATCSSNSGPLAAAAAAAADSAPSPSAAAAASAAAWGGVVVMFVVMFVIAVGLACVFVGHECQTAEDAEALLHLLKPPSQKTPSPHSNKPPSPATTHLQPLPQIVPLRERHRPMVRLCQDQVRRRLWVDEHAARRVAQARRHLVEGLPDVFDGQDAQGAL